MLRGSCAFIYSSGLLAPLHFLETPANARTRFSSAGSCVLPHFILCHALAPDRVEAAPQGIAHGRNSTWYSGCTGYLMASTTTAAHALVAAVPPHSCQRGIELARRKVKGGVETGGGSCYAACLPGGTAPLRRCAMLEAPDMLVSSCLEADKGVSCRRRASGFGELSLAGP